MHLTTIQEKMIQDVGEATLALGGMRTRFGGTYDWTIGTKAGTLHIQPEFDGISLKFLEPARANAQGIPSHHMKGTMKLELPLGSYNDPAAAEALIERYRNFIQPLRVS